MVSIDHFKLYVAEMQCLKYPFPQNTFDVAQRFIFYDSCVILSLHISNTMNK